MGSLLDYTAPSCPFAGLRGEQEGLHDESIERELAAFVKDSEFPCLGAKAAFNTKRATVVQFKTLGCPLHIPHLATALSEFIAASKDTPPQKLKTFVACFEGPRGLDEEAFERLMWQELQELRNLDAKTPLLVSPGCLMTQRVLTLLIPLRKNPSSLSAFTPTLHVTPGAFRLPPSRSTSSPSSKRSGRAVDGNG